MIYSLKMLTCIFRQHMKNKLYTFLMNKVPDATQNGFFSFIRCQNNWATIILTIENYAVGIFVLTTDFRSILINK